MSSDQEITRLWRVEASVDKLVLDGKRDPRRVADVLQEILDETSTPCSTALTPPPGGRIHILRVPVIQNRDWREAVKAAGPDTPDSNDVHQVGDLYQPVGTGCEEEEFILVNFGSGKDNWERALAWGREHSLDKTNPRQVFAIGEHQPELHRTPGMNPMSVVATEECTFDGGRRACYVWWGDTRRRAHLSWLEYFDGAYYWFAFSRKISAKG